MPVVFTQHGPIPHSVTPNRRQTGDAIDCIHQLTYADAFRVAAKSEMCVANQMRLDMQGIVPATATESARQNLQVQIGPSSVAHVDVSQDLMTDDPQNQIGVIRKIKTGLRLSLQTGNKVHIRGTIT